MYTEELERGATELKEFVQTAGMTGCMKESYQMDGWTGMSSN